MGTFKKYALGFLSLTLSAVSSFTATASETDSKTFMENLKNDMSVGYDAIFKFGAPVVYTIYYGKILLDYADAWNHDDVERIISHFDDDFIYTDQLLPRPITNKADMRKYLQLYFATYPRQSWTKNTVLYITYKAETLAVSYDFKFGSDQRMLSGTGMEKYVFKGKLIKEAHLHLMFDDMDISKMIGFPMDKLELGNP